MLAQFRPFGHTSWYGPNGPLRVVETLGRMMTSNGRTLRIACERWSLSGFPDKDHLFSYGTHSQCFFQVAAPASILSFMSLSPRLEQLTILLIEDSPLVSSRLVRMLRSMAGVELVASVREPREALLAGPILLPDVAILCLHSYRRSRLQTVKGLAKMGRPITIVVLSNSPGPQMRSAYIRAGASLFFDKTMEFDKLHSALLHLAAHETMTQQGQSNGGEPNGLSQRT